MIILHCFLIRFAVLFSSKIPHRGLSVISLGSIMSLNERSILQWSKLAYKTFAHEMLSHSTYSLHSSPEKSHSRISFRWSRVSYFPESYLCELHCPVFGTNANKPEQISAYLLSNIKSVTKRIFLSIVSFLSFLKGGQFIIVLDTRVFDRSADIFLRKIRTLQENLRNRNIYSTRASIWDCVDDWNGNFTRCSPRR